MYPVVLVLGTPFTFLLPLFGMGGAHGPNVQFAGYQVCVCLLVGGSVGWFIGRFFPQFAKSGRWIWVLPAAVLAPALVTDFRTSSPYLSGLLFATGDNERLGVYLISLPSASAIGYSIGMIRAGKRLPAAFGVASAFFFVALLMIAHQIENVRVDAWNRTKFVIDPQGLPFSGDPAVLCGSGEAQILPWRTAVMVSEQQKCEPGRQLEPNEPVGSGRTLLRVKVLSGPLAGARGWMLAYGLQ